MMQARLTPLAVSLGDPAGVGPELAVRAFAEADRLPPFYVIGDPQVLAEAARRLGAMVRLIESPQAPEAALCRAGLVVRPEPLATRAVFGAPSADNAASIVACVARGVSDCLAGSASGLVTLPLAKSVLYAAGFPFPGHTELIANLTEGAPWPHPRGPVMMLASRDLKVALATIHIPLHAVATALSTPRLVEIATVTAQALKSDFGVPAPRLAFAGLNPHAGENGALGREEIEIINPAAALLRASGIDAQDAAPADSLFHQDARQRYDAVIAMYHDQGLIPIKTLDFWGAVNVTLGLPIVRTSPDHGAAFAIAGQGIARTDSFKAALRLASALAARRAGLA